jgi:large-conductance mechanosensitive channel
MSFAFLGDLIVVTAINFVIVTGITFGVLYTIDKINEKKDKE